MKNRKRMAARLLLVSAAMLLSERALAGDAVEMTPLTAPIMAGRPVTFTVRVSGSRSVREVGWDFGDGQSAAGARVRHTYSKPGIYQVRLSASKPSAGANRFAIVRVHTPRTVHVPQVFLDTDQKNEQDDQHYFGYALFSQLDVLGINSVHHGGGQEPTNYAEILHVLDLAKKSGLSAGREPLVFHGANRRLDVPKSGRWEDTQPAATDASRAIVAAAIGASPSNPLWVVPVGPGTNVASAILLARARGLKLEDHMRVLWIGSSNTNINGDFNGRNDPWSMYIVTNSGYETWIMTAPVSARVGIDQRTEKDLYADNPLGRYLKKITPANRYKPLFDPSALAAIISNRLALGWVRAFDYASVAGPANHYLIRRKSKTPARVRVIRKIDARAMKRDIFNTMKGNPTRLIGVPPRADAK